MLILSKSLSVPPERDGMLGLVLSATRLSSKCRQILWPKYPARHATKNCTIPHVCCRLNRLNLFGAFSSQDYRGLLESLFIKASQHENPSGQNPTAGCFFNIYFCTSVYNCIHLCTEAWHCSLCFSSPGAGLQPAFHRNGCSLLLHPRTNTCSSHAPVFQQDSWTGRKSRKAPLSPCTLSILVPLSVNLHVHLASLLASVDSIYVYMYYELLWQILINDI